VPESRGSTRGTMAASLPSFRGWYYRRTVGPRPESERATLSNHRFVLITYKKKSLPHSKHNDTISVRSDQMRLNILCGQHAKFFTLAAAGKDSNHTVLQGWQSPLGTPDYRHPIDEKGTMEGKEKRKKGWQEGGMPTEAGETVSIQNKAHLEG
jgi:hypothetical protein